MTAAEPASAPFVLTLSSRTLPRLLLAIVLSLLAIHVALQYDRFNTHVSPWEIQLLFDLDEETSVPNWYSTAALGLAAVLAAAIASKERADGTAAASRWRAVAWVLGYLCFDEVAGVHETVNSLSPISWTVPFGLLAVVVGAWMLPFVLRLPASTRNGIILAGLLYVASATGVELVSSQFFNEANKRQFDYALNTVVEEGGEMLAVVVMIRTLLKHMERTGGTASIVLRPGPTPG